jgi:CSLREA domain-containing protein
MRTFRSLASAMLLLSGGATADTLVVTSLGDGAGACPDSSACTLRAAIAAALPDDRIEFSPDLALPAILSLSGTELPVTKSLTLAGPGAARLTVRAASGNRVLNLTSGTLVIEALTLDRGRALGENGGSGGTGLAGQPGGGAEGGCIITSTGTTLMLERVALRDCRAIAGAGGNGGTGAAGASGATGGGGGTGGLARGGAIFARGALALIESSISESDALGGDGGNGGTGGAGSSTEGSGGNGGAGGGARGGAISLAGAGAALLVRNSTLAGNLVEGGDGGIGGSGGNGAATGQGVGGNGGSGGLANGGHVHLESVVGVVDFEFASLGPSPGSGGAAGSGGNGQPSGTPGASGGTIGELLFAAKSPRVRSSVFVGGFTAADCAGTAFVTASGDNLDSDDSCAGFTGNANFAANFVGPAPLIEAGRAVLRPRAGAPAIDVASDCLDLDGAAVEVDQGGRGRPLDGDGDLELRCDLGAIEFSFGIFRDGFEVVP